MDALIPNCSHGWWCPIIIALERYMRDQREMAERHHRMHRKALAELRAL